jgi:transposase
MGKIRRSEYGRLSGKDRRFIKGQRYNLLRNSENLTLSGKQSLQALLAANKRLNTAYVLKESFSRLWTYTYEASARKFFENWKASLPPSSRRTMSLSTSLKASTTKSGSSSGGPTAFETRSTFASRS